MPYALTKVLDSDSRYPDWSGLSGMRSNSVVKSCYFTATLAVLDKNYLPPDRQAAGINAHGGGRED
jgi:hypothetical protein